MAPPKKATPEPSKGAELLERLRRGRDAHRVVNWPGSDVQVQLVPLDDDTLMACQAAAYRYFERIGLQLDTFNADDLHAEIARQVLARSLRVYDPEHPERRSELLFASADDLREHIESHERAALTAVYVSLKDDCDPDPDELDREEVEAMLQLVKKKDGRTLSKFDSPTLARFAITLADRLQS